jgi:hypothetical protein
MTVSVSIKTISDSLKSNYDAVKYDPKKYQEFVRDLIPLYEKVILPLASDDRAGFDRLDQQIKLAKAGPVPLPSRHLLPLGILGLMATIGYVARDTFSSQNLKSALISKTEWMEVATMPFAKSLVHFFTPAIRSFDEINALKMLGYDVVPVALGAALVAGASLAILNLTCFQPSKKDSGV